METRSSSFAIQSKEGDAGHTESPLFFVPDCGYGQVEREEKKKALPQRAQKKSTLRKRRSGQAEVTEKSDPVDAPLVTA
jgi:hypothetical protein